MLGEGHLGVVSSAKLRTPVARYLTPKIFVSERQNTLHSADNNGTALSVPRPTRLGGREAPSRRSTGLYPPRARALT